MLNRDLTAKVYRAGTGGCIVESGTRKVEPYTGIPNYRYVRGGSYAQGLDIDHVTALGDAWQTGAQQWTLAKRESLANDPVNLLAVDPSQNRQKGDADAASWLPANKSFRCTYVAIQVTVKAKYGLWVTSAEKAAMQRILRACPNQPLATTTPLPATAQPVSQPVATTTATPAATSPGSGAATPSGCEPGYSPCLPVTTDLNCSDIPASKKPVHVTGDDPYRLDADHDGLGCTS